MRVELWLDLMSKQKGYVVQLGGSKGPVKLGAVLQKRRIVDRLAYATSSTLFLPLNLPYLRGK